MNKPNIKTHLDFRSFGFSESLLNSLEAMGFNEPTPVQEKAIPEIKQGKDIIACAQTGTGKTAAYILPLLDLIQQGNIEGTSTLIVVPTRELAQQVDQEIEGFGYFLNISSIAIYGGGSGADWDTHKKALQSGVEVIIGTPGRLITHMNMGHIDLGSIKHLVLDEADRMLDMGFIDDIQRLIKELPEKHQTLLFSATMPPKIRKLSQTILNDPSEVSISISKPAEQVLQVAYMAYDHQKSKLVEHLIENKGKEELQSVIIFASTKRKVADLKKQLTPSLGSDVASISSDLDQQEREEVLRKFKNRRCRVLIATDVLSRGIDIKSVDLIINYDVPQDPEDYVHRIGRTGRASESGLAITLINDVDQEKFDRIDQFLGEEIKKLPLLPSIGEGPTYAPKKGQGNKGGGKGKPHGKKKGPPKGKPRHARKGRE